MQKKSFINQSTFKSAKAQSFDRPQTNMKSDEIIEKIRKKLQDSDPDKRTVKEIFQFEFTDVNGKCLKNMVFDFNGINLYEGICEAADAKITIHDEDFYSIGTHQTTFDELMNQKKIQIQGDTEAINKIMEKFRMNQKNE